MGTIPPTKKKKKEIILPRTFYQRDSLIVAQELLGKWLFTSFNNQLTGGIISETECYRGAEDRASHAYNHRRTKRTEILYQPGGVAYIHLCYGIHTLINVVTNSEEIPHGVLIRAIIPQIGIPIMEMRRNKKTDLATGPGSLCQALGITMKQYGSPLQGPEIWIEDRKTKIQEFISTPRIGVDYAGVDAALPFRFVLAKEQ